MKEIEYGLETGSECKRDGCKGIIEEHERRDCSCHINPPCSACTEARAYCPECGWEEIDEKPLEIAGMPAQLPRKKLEAKIEWDIVRQGQAEVYQDSIYEYRVKSSLPDCRIESFCTLFLRPCTKKGQGFNGHDGFNQSTGHGLDHYYSFVKESEDVYVYKVCEPFTG